MKNFLLSVLLLIAFGEVVTLYIMHKPASSDEVLGETVTITPSPTVVPTPSPTLIPTATPTPKPTPKPTSTPIPEPTFTSEQINGFIDRFAAQYGVDPNVIRHIALCESGFNPMAKHMGYAGLFQFGAVTWKNLRLKIGEDINVNLRFNAEEAVQTAAYAISIGDISIWPNCHP